MMKLSRTTSKRPALPLAILVVLAAGVHPAAAQLLSVDTDASAVISGAHRGAAEWGDYDGDGDVDLVLTGFSGSTDNGEVYRNDPTGTFTLDAAASAVVDDLFDSAAAWGDYDGDGDLDLVVIGIGSGFTHVSEVYRNDPEGTLSLDAAASAALSKVAFGTVEWVDFDNDNDLDLVLSGELESGNLVGEIYENDGTGVLTLEPVASAVIPDVSLSALAWGDYDGDGDLDLVVTGRDFFGVPVGEVYENDPPGTLTSNAAASAVVADVRGSAVAWGDYDGDGFVDLVVIGRLITGAEVGYVYRNDGAGSFDLDADASGTVVDVASGAVAWADYDNDGDLDLALTGIDESGEYVGELYRNDPEGTLSLDAVASAVIADVARGRLAWGDYDKDDDLDLLLTGVERDVEHNVEIHQGILYRNDSAPPNRAPRAVISGGSTFECNHPIRGGTVHLSGLLSSDPDGDPLTYSWTEDGRLLGTGTLLHTSLRLGQHTILLTVTDTGDLTNTDEIVVTVEDTEAPVLTLLGANPLTIDVGDPYVEPGGTAEDACQGDLTSSIQIDASSVDTGTPDSYAVIYRVSDRFDNTATKPRVVDVVDASDPVIAVGATPRRLFPPNHSYHAVKLSALKLGVSDAFDGELDAADVVIKSVWSDEPESGEDDGNTLDDIVIAEDCRSVRLRAERTESGNGRVYTLLLAATDPWGNEGTAIFQVLVPVGKQGSAIDDGVEVGYLVEGGCSAAAQALLTGSAGNSLDAAQGVPVTPGNLAPAGAQAPDVTSLPDVFSLDAAYPNPFNPSTTIPFALADASFVRLEVYDLLGRSVVVLVERSMEAGRHEARFDGSRLPSAVYLARLEAGGQVFTQRVVLLK